MSTTLVFREKNQLGPFNDAYIMGELQNGRLSYDDLGWREGMDAWKPLRQLYPPPVAESAHLQSVIDSVKKGFTLYSAVIGVAKAVFAHTFAIGAVFYYVGGVGLTTGIRMLVVGLILAPMFKLLHVSKLLRISPETRDAVYALLLVICFIWSFVQYAILHDEGMNYSTATPASITALIILGVIIVVHSIFSARGYLWRMVKNLNVVKT
jgi:GYF domain 2